MKLSTSTKEKVQKVLSEIESQGYMMIVGPEKGKVLIDVVEKVRPKRILEIGTFVGYSAIKMAGAADKDIQLTSIDIDKNNARLAKENIKNAGLSDQVKVVVDDAKEVIPTLSGPFEVIFIDAVKDEYYDYLKKAENKLSPHAVVVADNVKVFKDAMQDYLQYVRSSEKYQSNTIDFGNDAMEVSIYIPS